MDEQTEPGGTAGSTRTDPGPTGHQGGPRVTGSQVRDLNQLRRSSTDRYLGGVAGGLGRHLDVDPTVIRVALVVLTLFGGAGLILYVALWLFVPSDTSSRAPIRINPEVQAGVVVGVLVISTLVFLGSTFSDHSWGFGFPLVFVLIASAVVYLAVRDRRDTRARNASAYPPPPAATAPAGGTMTTTDAPAYAAAPETSSAYPPPPAWMPPRPPAYVPPPRPRRTGLVLFWPTLALIAIALGSLGIVDGSSSVPVSAYAALAVAVTGAMLVVGAFVGRPGGLIALGLLTSFVMLVSGGVQAATGGATSQRTLDASPTTSAAVSADYSVQNGSIELDLRGVTDPANLDGRITTVQLNAGDIVVRVPRTVDVHVVADIRYAGHIEIGDEVRDGFQPRLDTTVSAATPTSPTPTLELVVKARVGSITVQHD